MPKRPAGRSGSKPRKGKKKLVDAPAGEARNYSHPDAKSVARPDVGVQAQFRKKKPPKTYRYDSSLSPSLEWDEQPAREKGEALIARLLEAETLDQARAAAEELKGMSRPFLNWAGKAERQAFDVPTLPLFVHERLSTRAILDTVRRHELDKQEALDLFGDPKRPLVEQLRAYEYQDDWINRMILGDTLVVMNSLLEYEGMAGVISTHCAGDLEWRFDEGISERCPVFPVGGAHAGTGRHRLSLPPRPVATRLITFRFHCRHAGCSAAGPCGSTAWRTIHVRPRA